MYKKYNIMKVWFITGASRGFGRIWADAALRRGDKVVATARKLASIEDLKEKYGDNVLTLGLVFNEQMLQMWGKFPDMRLFDAVRALPEELRWRGPTDDFAAVCAAMDAPGIARRAEALAATR